MEKITIFFLFSTIRTKIQTLLIQTRIQAIQFKNKTKNTFRSFNLISHDLEHSDGSDATYLLTPSQLCQNPSHAHHHSHHASHNRFPVADTVVEESTGGSIESVIINTATTTLTNTTITATTNSRGNTPNNNTFPPDIILTNSEAKNDTIPVHPPTHVDEIPPKVTRSLSIKSMKSPKSMDQIDEMADTEIELVDEFSPMSPSQSQSPPPILKPSLPPSKTTAPATDQNSNTSNEAGTDSISTNSIQFHFRPFCKHTTTNHGRNLKRKLL